MSTTLERPVTLPSAELIDTDNEVFERESAHVKELFNDANEEIINLQYNPGFLSYLKSKNIEDNFELEEFWEAIEFVGNVYADKGGLGKDEEKIAAFKLAASAPNAMFKQMSLDRDQKHFEATGEHLLSRQKSNTIKEKVVSPFNTTLRDFAADHAAVNIDDLSSRVALAASLGLEKKDIARCGELTASTLKGIRTELGFEQKLTTAGLSWKRGSTENDLEGVDYIVEGVKIDVKSSLQEILKKSPGNEGTYFIKNGKVTYYPYDHANDYAHGSFIVEDKAGIPKSQQIARDVSDMKQYLHI